MSMEAKPKPEYLELSEESRIEQQRYEEAMKKLEMKQKARSVVVPTAVEDVKAKLRELGHPITLFGEDHAERRDRLKEVVAALQLSQEEATRVNPSLKPSTSNFANEAAPGKPGNQKEIVYSQAGEALIQFRKDLATLSFEKAHQRLLSTKRLREDDSLQAEQNLSAAHLYQHSKELVLNLSQFADERPLSIVRYNGDGSIFATGSLSPLVKIWNSKDLASVKVLRGHTDRVMGISWRTNPTNQLLATSSADGNCIIWNCNDLLTTNNGSGENTSSTAMVVEETPAGSSSESKKSLILQKLKAPNTIVADCDFHPYMNVVGTACHDQSWRLWDIETGQELLLQDGHLKECTSLSFHPDGSLVFTTDAGGVGLLWDLRSGQMIQGFQGHIKRVNHSSFHANGFEVATSSIDNTVKIWDLRKRKCHYTLPAHSTVISDVRFSKSGELLLTSSFDGTAKVWNGRDYTILRTLSGHNGKVMSCDFAPNERRVVSAGFDRTVKLWAHKDDM